MMRHHDREILPSSFPGKEGSNAIEVESALAHVDKLHRKPTTLRKCYFMYNIRLFNPVNMVNFIQPCVHIERKYRCIIPT